MWTSFESWQIAQLQRLSEVDLEEVESALNALWADRPEMLEQITISALDQDQITADRAAEVLHLSLEQVEQSLAAFRRRALKRCCVVVCDGAVAKLADGGLPVWEVVRVYRKLGSFERLHETFSGLSLQTLESALAYAEHHPEEVEAQIKRYEDLLKRRKSEYPYVR